jgi:hypothetical protein
MEILIQKFDVLNENGSCRSDGECGDCGVVCNEEGGTCYTD